MLRVGSRRSKSIVYNPVSSKERKEFQNMANRGKDEPFKVKRFNEDLQELVGKHQPYEQNLSFSQGQMRTQSVHTQRKNVFKNKITLQNQISTGTNNEDHSDYIYRPMTQEIKMQYTSDL